MCQFQLASHTYHEMSEHEEEVKPNISTLIAQQLANHTMKSVNRPPSKSKSCYWYIAHSSHPHPRPNPPNIGKWLIFEDRRRIDEVWTKIQRATIEGNLGFASKVSTRKKKAVEIGGMTSDHVICVYTYGTDEDKQRVRDGLTELGFVRHLHYKPDAATSAGIYSTNKATSTSAPSPSADNENNSAQTPSTSTAPSDTILQNSIAKQGDESSSPKKLKFEAIQGAEAAKYPNSYTMSGCTNPLKVYKTTQRFYSYQKSFCHIQQLYPPPLSFSKPPDVHFPLEQLGQICDAFYHISNTKPTPEGSDEKIQILDTGDVKVFGQRQEEVFDGAFVIVVEAKSKCRVKFMQTDGIYCYKRLEWFRQRPDIEGEDQFSSDESPDEEEEQFGWGDGDDYDDDDEDDEGPTQNIDIKVKEEHHENEEDGEPGEGRIKREHDDS